MRLIITLVTIIPTVKTNEPAVINGVGATFPEHVYKAWGIKYETLRRPFKQVDFRYNGINSGAGECNIARNCSDDGAPHLFAGSDKQFTPWNGLISFPTLAGAVVVVYNVPGVSLILNGAALAAIYEGKIAYWNDTLIQQLNPYANMPAQPITIVGRRDTSGNTEVFTKALSSFSDTWKKNYGYFSNPLIDDNDVSHAWPKGRIKVFTEGHLGVVGFLTSVQNTISYLSFSEAFQYKLEVAAMYNTKGKLITVRDISNGVYEAMDFFINKKEAILVRDIIDAPVENAYPIATLTYHIINMTTADDISCGNVEEYVRFMDWALTHNESRAVVKAYGEVPMSDESTDVIKEKILKKITCNGENMFERVIDSKKNELAISAQDFWSTTATVVVAIISMVFLFIIAGILTYFTVEKQKNLDIWKLNPNSISIYRSSSSLCELPGIGSIISISSGESFTRANGASLPRGKYGDSNVLVYLHDELTWPTDKNSRTLLQTLCRFKEEDNLATFLGLSQIEKAGTLMVYHCNPKGRLHDALHSICFDLSNEIKILLYADVCKGLEFLHKHGIIHGQLNSCTCVVDGRWTVKLTAWAYFSVLKSQHMTKAANFLKPPEASLLNMDVSQLDDIRPAISIVYMDPELRNPSANEINLEYDIYSMGVLLAEQFNLGNFYNTLRSSRVSSIHTFRPDLSKNETNKLLRGCAQLAAVCIGQELNNRPTASILLAEIKKIKDESKATNNETVVDLLLAKLWKMDELERKVDERTKDLKNVTERMESLLCQLMPKEVAEKLQTGETVEPKYFESVTIYFSDIVDFTSISAKATPIQIVNMLNSLYTSFDSVIDCFDVYKVETIGDAYMVASGLPKTNGENHYKEICKMALFLRNEAKRFKIGHLPNQKFQIRIGVNSGPVMAGVVGLKMPRYCLFGDAVNLASRMESTSLPMKIHISHFTAERVKSVSGFSVITRGSVAVKGRGQVDTYWLESDANSTSED